MLAVATSRCHPIGATLLLALLLAGCAPPATSALTTCQALAAARLSRNAPLAGMLAGSPDALARALAKAAGDPVTQGPRAATDFTGRPVTRWDTGEGRVERYNDEDGRFLLLRWWSKRHFTPLDGSRAESDITSVLTALGLTPDAPPVLRQQPDRLTIHVSRSYRGTQLVYCASRLASASASWAAFGRRAAPGHLKRSFIFLCLISTSSAMKPPPAPPRRGGARLDLDRRR